MRVVLLLVVLGWSCPVLADTITIQPGSSYITLPGQRAIADLHGDGFDVAMGPYDVGIGMFALQPCPCWAGEPLTGISSVAERDWSGAFFPTPFQVPDARLSPVFTVPFQFTGYQYAPRRDLVGSGLATFTFQPVDNYWSAFVSARYDFTAQQTASLIPNPEPGTWLLLSTGILSLWRKRNSC